MKNVIIILVGVLLLTGCGKQASQAPKQVIVKVAFTNDSTSVTTNSQMMHHSFGISFKTDTSRDTVVQQLEQLHAPILTNTPELIRAELPRKVQVELSFAVGKLTEVNYIMPPNTARGCVKTAS